MAKKVILPSTFKTRNYQTNEKSADTLDLNSIFWDYLFSVETVKSLFDKYVSVYNPDAEFKSYLKFIVANLNATKAITSDVFSLHLDGKISLYCFKVYYFILSIFNKMDKNQRITLPYGIFFNHPIENIEVVVSDDKNIIKRFFSHVLNNNSFFKDNDKYTFRIHWENESYVILLLAHMMREKFNNIQISLDLGDVNEQIDFSFWKTVPIFNKYIDSFEDIYYSTSNNAVNNPSQATIDFGDSKKLVTRLFDTKCFWGKCSFCTINSRFLSEKRVETLNKSAAERVDDLVSYIKKTKELLALVFMDEAIEASILIYFAKQLLKHEIDIRWNARSRFSDKYTLENCKILSKAGLRFLGFGLESVNQRVLTLMNKREREYSKTELDNIFENCDKAGVNSHAYFMIGFPSETKDETDETLEFIDKQLNSRRYFTYSANVFYLMKGSGVYNDHDKYSIRINDKYESVKLSDIDFIDNSPGEKYTRNELAYLSRRAYSKLFFKEKDLDYAMVQMGYAFWDFLDRAGIFYNHKLIYSCNPYLFEVSIDSLNDTILDQRFSLLPMFITSDNSKYEYYNVMNEKRVSIKDDIRGSFIFFVANFKPEATLRANIDGCLHKLSIGIDSEGVASEIQTLNKKKMFEKYIIKLIKDSYLYSYS